MPKPFTFTHLDFMAFVLMREDAKQREEVPPVWMCCSEQVREEWRDKAVESLSHMLLTPTRECAEKLIESTPTLSDMRKKWEQTERRFEKDREAGNPTAFFANP